MPKNTRRYKRRRPRRTRIVRKRKSVVYRNINAFNNGFPMKLTGTMTYSNAFNLAPGTTAAANKPFNINSLFDPGITTSPATSDQPAYYDKLLSDTLYDVYKCYAVNYEVSFNNKGSHDAQVLLKFGNAETSIPTTASALFGFRDSKYTKYGITTSTNTTRSRKVFRGRMAMWPLVAQSRGSYNLDRSSYQGKHDTNPTILAKMILAVADDPQGASGANVDCYVKLTFHYVLSNLAMDVA